MAAPVTNEKKGTAARERLSAEHVKRKRSERGVWGGWGRVAGEIRSSIIRYGGAVTRRTGGKGNVFDPEIDANAGAVSYACEKTPEKLRFAQRSSGTTRFSE